MDFMYLVVTHQVIVAVDDSGMRCFIPRQPQVCVKRLKILTWVEFMYLVVTRIPGDCYRR